MRLNNKVILITGGYTGIGKAIAQASVREGAKVVVNGLETDKGKVLVTEMGTENALALTMDITDAGAPQKLVEEAVAHFGKLDAVVNNAAYIASSDINSTDIAFLQRMLAVNTIAPFAIIQAALPYLSQVRGCVLNIGSI